jgi:hypothetical protein
VDQKDFKWSKNLIGLMMKIRLVSRAVCFEGLNIIIHKESIVQDYLTTVTRLIVFYPAGSAFGRLSILSNGKFHKAWLDR